ncbi:hypothetical protein Q7C20_11945 [Pseudomonas sp. AMR01]
MAVDMFLMLGDIKGESRDEAHRDEKGGPVKFGWNIRQNQKI